MVGHACMNEHVSTCVSWSLSTACSLTLLVCFPCLFGGVCSHVLANVRVSGLGFRVWGLGHMILSVPQVLSVHIQNKYTVFMIFK